MASFDADIKTIEMKKLPEKYNFIKNIAIPSEYKLNNCYNVYIKVGELELIISQWKEMYICCF